MNNISFWEDWVRELKERIEKLCEEIEHLGKEKAQWLLSQQTKPENTADILDLNDSYWGSHPAIELRDYKQQDLWIKLIEEWKPNGNNNSRLKGALQKMYDSLPQFQSNSSLRDALEELVISASTAKRFMKHFPEYSDYKVLQAAIEKAKAALNNTDDGKS